jgi:tetratricopeptide (TPR) repeat protein
MALEKDPGDRYALMGMGDLYVKTGRDDKALTFYEKFIREVKDPIVALTSAASIYRRRKQYEKAMAYYDRVLATDPEDSHAWHGKADCHRGMKSYRAAIRAWRSAVEHGMNPRIAMTRIGDAFMSLDDLEQAEASYQEALSMGYDKWAYLGMARIHSRRNQVTRVVEIFSMFLENDSEDLRIAAELRGVAQQHPQIGEAFPGFR